MSNLTLTDAPDGYLDVRFGEAPLFRYVYQPDTPQIEAPRPYFHPLYTLAGNVVTGFRPADHAWHHGLSMTVAYLSGENFWGGPTYIRDQGYTQLANNGRQVHDTWEEITHTPQRIALAERLTWITQRGDRWIDELRQIEVNTIDPERGFWCLDMRFRLRNCAGHDLEFGSPTTQGRPQAGYGGLFWRGGDDFPGGTVLIEGGHCAEGDEMAIQGQRGAWLAYVSPAHTATLILADQPANPRYPNQWFIRASSTAYVCCAFMFDRVFTLAPDADLALAYRIIVANGAWSADEIGQIHAADGMTGA